MRAFYPKKDKTEEVRNILSAMVEPTRAESGNKTYDLFSMKSESNEETFHLFEIYDGKEALEFTGALNIIKITEQILFSI